MAPAMTRRTVRVPAIDCIHCVRTIERELARMDGVESVEADETSRTVTVAFEPQSLWPEIEGFMAAIGYPTEEPNDESAQEGG